MYKNNNNNFAVLLELFLQQISPGSIIKAKIVNIDENFITVDAGLKSSSNIPAYQFKNKLSVGEEVYVAIDAVEDCFGETRLSRDRAKRAETWNKLEAALVNNDILTGILTGKVNGGFTVKVNNLRAFLPGSLVDVRPVHDATHLENKELCFKVIKLDSKRKNIVLSRRALIEIEKSRAQRKLLKVGQHIKGIVKNLTNYGAFIDIGGVDGLLHITDMAWKRIKHPTDILAIGDDINVKVLKLDLERNRVSLGLKQVGVDPWRSIHVRYPVNTKVMARITKLTSYGCFAELEYGVEGLVHVSEMTWNNLNPSKLVHIGDSVNVMVLNIDSSRRRISLSIKQCTPKPKVK